MFIPYLTLSRKVRLRNTYPCFQEQKKSIPRLNLDRRNNSTHIQSRQTCFSPQVPWGLKMPAHICLFVSWEASGVR
ncbi:hypothetical protein C8Q75DRAFT_536164 [Abortiporus biennis]|nr:hypothetical protein C8Q75DRAFT_536164 [Abortiporus biennis]